MSFLLFLDVFGAGGGEVGVVPLLLLGALYPQVRVEGGLLIGDGPEVGLYLIEAAVVAQLLGIARGLEEAQQLLAAVEAAPAADAGRNGQVLQRVVPGQDGADYLAGGGDGAVADDGGR